jgi:SWI/SNF-related matrix-associated actin-dependent regulator 1 of chromatin subfamily A
MKIHWDSDLELYWAELDGVPRGGTKAERDAYWGQKGVVKDAGFYCDVPGEKTGVKFRWYTRYPDTAEKLAKFAVGEAVGHFQKTKARRDLSRAIGGSMDIPAPEGKSYRPFQQSGIEYSYLTLQDRDAVLIGDDMGLGKTIQGLGVINLNKSIERVLVVCPPNGRIHWIETAQDWLVKDDRTWVYQRVTGNEAIDPNANFVVVGWSNVAMSKVKPGLMNGNFDLCIMDEAHYAKNTMSAARARTALGYWDREEKKTVEGIAHKAAKTIFTTGTPIPNRPKELFPMLTHLDPEGLGRGFLSFARRYCGGSQGAYGFDANGASHLDELQRKMRSSFMVRRLKTEVMSELPPIQRDLMKLDPKDVKGASKLLKEQAKLLREAGVEELIEEGKIEEAVAKLKANVAAFTQISRIRQQLGRLKAKHAVEFTEQALQSHKKVIVFAHHRDVQDELALSLDAYGVVQVKGGMGDEAKKKAEVAFQNDPNVRVFVGSIDACREVITLTEATTVIFAELPWRPGDVEQAEGRAYGRVNNPHGINSYYIVLDKSLDAYMAQTLQKKEVVIRAALDNDCEHEDVEVASYEKEVAKLEKAAEKAAQTGKPVVTAVQLTDADLETPPF